MVPMAAYEHLLKTYDIRDLLDDIASAGRIHYASACAKLKDTAVQALRTSRAPWPRFE
jgi:hypothetical protein